MDGEGERRAISGITEGLANLNRALKLEPHDEHRRLRSSLPPPQAAFQHRRPQHEHPARHPDVLSALLPHRCGRAESGVCGVGGGHSPDLGRDQRSAVRPDLGSHPHALGPAAGAAPLRRGAAGADLHVDVAGAVVRPGRAGAVLRHGVHPVRHRLHPGARRLQRADPGDDVGLRRAQLAQRLPDGLLDRRHAGRDHPGDGARLVHRRPAGALRRHRRDPGAAGDDPAADRLSDHPRAALRRAAALDPDARPPWSPR